jgi:membrane protein
LQELYRAWNADRPAQLAAAVAYYAMFSFVPVVFVSVTVASMFVDELATADQIYARLAVTMGPQTAQFVQDLVIGLADRPTRGTSLSSLISLVALLYAASGLFTQLQSALNAIWEVSPAEVGDVATFVKNRLLAFALVLGVGLLFVLATLSGVALSLVDALLDLDLGATVPWVNAGTALVLTALLFALLYKVLPNVAVAWRDVWLGAVVAAVLFNLGRWLVGFYITRFRIGSAFEAAGALAVLLIAIYYLAQIFLFGAVFTKVYAATFGSKAAPQWSKSASQRISE